jgi:AcrR family transcriptional regulator
MHGGLRERKKQETRTAIADAAMKLFIERGFDAVTVGDVAEAANVSEKTVFNYFPTKEDLFFDEAPARQAALVASIRDREPGESMVAAIRRSAAANCSRISSPDFAVFARVLEQSPALQARERTMFAGFTRAVADELVAEGAAEPEAHIACAACASVYHWMFSTARKRALAGVSGKAAATRLRAEVERGFDLIERGLGAFAPKRQTP